MAMTPKQQRFCDEYLIDLNATQAAIRAGYSEKYAHTNAAKLLQNTTIKDFLRNRMDAKEKDLIADQDEVLRYLTAVMRGEGSEEMVVVEGYGEGVSRATTVSRDISPKDRLKAAELLGKRYSIFKENMKLDVTPVVIGGDDGLED